MLKVKFLYLILFCSFTYCLNVMCEDTQSEQILMPLKNNGKYWPEQTRFLVLVHLYDGDVEWAKKLNFPYIIYEKEKPEKEPFSAINKAKAETNLLKFIAEFYDDLPENIIQVYQYEYKDYHEGSLVDILNSPNFELEYLASKTKGFWNFNKVVWRELPPIEGMIGVGFWPVAMAPTFENIEGYGNFMAGKKACAQFVVSRDRIRTLPKEFYSNLYFWLCNNTVGTVDTPFDPVTKIRLPTPIDSYWNSNHFTSRCMEKTWELIFTSHKPNEDIAIPVLISDCILKNSKKNISYISALYGANNYYRDVSSEVLYHFIRGDKMIIPATANFNHFFTDVVFGSAKTLKIKIGNREFEIPELREKDMVIQL